VGGEAGLMELVLKIGQSGAELPVEGTEILFKQVVEVAYLPEVMAAEFGGCESLAKLPVGPDGHKSLLLKVFEMVGLSR